MGQSIWTIQRNWQHIGYTRRRITVSFIGGRNQNRSHTVENITCVKNIVSFSLKGEI
jgi:hypothetical protein